MVPFTLFDYPNHFIVHLGSFHLIMITTWSYTWHNVIDWGISQDKPTLMWPTQISTKTLNFVSWDKLYILLTLMNNIRVEKFPLEWFSSSVLSNISSLLLLSLCANNSKWGCFFYLYLGWNVTWIGTFFCDVVYSKILHGIIASLMQRNFHCCFHLLPLVTWFHPLSFLNHVVEVNNFKECCL